FADQPPSEALTDFWTTWQPPKPQPPGSCWCYSNIGFITLGFAVSGVGSPASYDYLTLLSDVITGPAQLNMAATTTYANQNGANGPPGFEPDGTQASGPAADLYSSAPDMLTWLKANLSAADTTPLGTALLFAQQDQNVTQDICKTCQKPGGATK